MYHYAKYIFFIGLIAGVIACSDDSTGPDPEEAPEMPQVQSEEAQPDISFFEDNQPKMPADYELSETDNYYQARNWVISNSYTFTFAGVYSGFLMAGSNEDAVYEDGMWVWEYSYTYENESVSLKVTSEEVAGGYEWAMFWSYDDGETSVENYKMMEGVVSEDGSSGDWTFNTLDAETSEERIAYTSEWEVSSDTKSTMSVNWYDESGNTTLTADYDETQPEHYMTFSYPDDPEVTIYWNTDTQEGYYDSDGEQLCWDENFDNIECS